MTTQDQKHGKVPPPPALAPSVPPVSFSQPRLPEPKRSSKPPPPPPPLAGSSGGRIYEAPFTAPRPSKVPRVAQADVAARPSSPPLPPKRSSLPVPVAPAAPPVEELSASLLLEAPVPTKPTKPAAPPVEELSSSILLEAPAPTKPGHLPAAAVVEELTGSVLVEAPVRTKPALIPTPSAEELSGSVLLDEIEAAAVAPEPPVVASPPAVAPPPATDIPSELPTTRVLPDPATSAPLAGVPLFAPLTFDASPSPLDLAADAPTPVAAIAVADEPVAQPLLPEPVPPPVDVAPTPAVTELAAAAVPDSAVALSSHGPDSTGGDTDPFKSLSEALSRPSTDELPAAEPEVEAPALASSLPPPSEHASTPPLAALQAEEPLPRSVPPSRPAPPVDEISSLSRARILSPWAIRLATRPRWLSRTTIVAGGVAAGVLVVLLVSLRSGSKPVDPVREETRLTPAARPLPPDVVAVSPAETPVAAPTAPAAAPAPVAPPEPTACVLHGAPHPIAPRSLLGTDVTVVPAKVGFAVGYAPSANEGRVALLTATGESVAHAPSIVEHSRDAIRRVTPLLSGKRPVAVIDTGRSKAKMAVPDVGLPSASLDLAFRDGTLSAATRGSSKAFALWPLSDDLPIEEPHVASMATDPSRLVLTFRRGGAVFIGALVHTDGKFVAEGPLAHFDGLSGQVGAPVVAISGATALVTWADRPSADAPWGLRYSRFSVGEAPPSPVALPLPPGGHGDQAMAPGIAGLPGGRFLVAWTEGLKPAHQVRAQTFRADMSPVGAPIVLSEEGVNAGQAALGIAPSGEGLAAFLSATDSGYALSAAALSCGVQ